MISYYDLSDPIWGLQQPSYWQITNGNRQYLSNMGISYAEQKAKYPNYIGLLESKGWTQDRIMGLTHFTVVYNEAAHQNPYNRISIKIPAGHWSVNAPLKLSQGITQGVGSGGVADTGAWGTTLSLEGVKWMGDPLKRHIFESWNRYEGKSEWSHATKVLNMSLCGEMKAERDPTYQSAGILIENPGETSVIEHVYTTGFNDFGVFIDGGGAPTTIHNSSYFYNHRAGIGIGSAAISVVRIIEPSGDLNPYLIETLVGTDGSPAGGCITIISPKSEPNPNPNSHARPGRGQMLAKFSGYFRVNIIGGQSWGHNGMRIDSAIRLESENPTGGLYDNYLRWDGLNLVGHEHILHDVSNNKKFKAGADFNSGVHDIIWTSKAGGRAVTTFLPNDAHNATSLMAEVPQIIAPYKGRQPWINSGEYQAGKTWNQTGGGTTGGPINPINNIVVTPSSVQVNKGQTTNLSATVQGTGTFDGTVVWNIITGGGSLNTTTGNQVVFTAPENQVTNDAFTQIRAVANGNRDVMATVDITIKNTSSTNAVTSISATSNKNNVDEGTTATLTAVVTGTGTFNNGVTWSIISGGGVLSNANSNPVTYTAPIVSSDTPLVIRATSVGDSSKTANVSMTIKNVDTPPVATITAVTASSNITTLNEGTNATLTATVGGTGAYNSNVTWSIVSGGGTLSNNNLNSTTYTAPQVNADSTAVVRAVAVGDTTKMANVTLTVKNVVTPSTITSVTATSNPSSIQSNQTSAINATVSGTGPFNTGVTWTIVSGGGSITNTANNSTTYTAPNVSVITPVTLRATANGDNTKSTTITITVSPVVASGLELSRSGWSASASHYNTGGSNEPAGNALDGDVVSYWTNGIAQASGQWFQVDMKAAQVFNKIIIDTSSITFTDYIRGCQVFVSNDGTNWGSAVATATGAPSATQYTINSLTITFATQTARYIRVVLNASSTGNWWAIGMFRVFSPQGTSGTITSVTASANPSTINSGGAAVLNATVVGTGSFNNNVTWSIVNGGGTLSSTSSNPSTYTAPITTTDVSVQLRATSVGDPTKTTTVNLTVKGVTTPPPTTGGISPSDVLIVVNANDPTSAALANEYATAWGIPAANKVTVNLGTSHVVSDATFNAERAKVIAASTAAHQFYALCFAYPSRVGGEGPLNSTQAITSALAYGRRNVTTLTTNTLLNYNGLKPFTDKGVRPSWMVMKTAYIKRNAHGARPTGMMYSIASKDQNPPARGSVRASQCAALDSRPNFEYIDVRNVSEVNYGQNPYQTPQNWAFDKYLEIFNKYKGNGVTYPAADPRGTLFTKKPLAAAFLAMNNYDRLEEMDRQLGWVGDCVTSFAGYMPDGAGQTPLTYMLDLGASTACGLVAEPSSNFVPQFTDLTKFVPMWYDQKLPNAVAFWGSTQAIDRMLIAGDGMCAPFI